MIKAAIICFTEKGACISKRIKDMADNNLYQFELFAKYESFDDKKYKDICAVSESLSDWTISMQKNKIAIIFIGAMGIAVRAIAAGIESKLSDSPVLVVDELGYHVIPVIAGHIGGANEMAMHVASVLNATPVITTATDLESCFSVDLFAKENNLKIFNKDGIAKVSSKALSGKVIRLSIENYPPMEADVIISDDNSMKSSGDILLCPKKYAVGIGCKKGTEYKELRELFINTLNKNKIDINDIGAIGSIDLKEEENGLCELCSFYRIPFITYTKELLEKAKGSFSESEFVREKTGVGNVCERAAMLLTGNKGEIVQKKISENGMTIAIARMR